MLKFAIAATTVVAAGTTAYLVHAHNSKAHAPAPTAPAVAAVPVTPTLHYGSSKLGLAHAPTLGPTAAPRAIASRSVAEADLAILPADADAVIGLNFAQIRHSVLWQKYVAPKLAGVDGIREFKALCGFDPLTSLDSVSIGLKGFGSDNDVTGAIIVHGFDKTKAMTCFDDKGVAEAQKDGSKVAIDGDVVLITDADGKGHAAFTFIDNTTALIVVGPQAATKQSVEKVAAGNEGVQSSSTFAEALQAINTDDSLWLMVADTSPLVAIVNAATAPYTSTKLGTLYVSMNVTDSLALDAGLRLGTPASVAKIVAAIQTQLTKQDIGPALKQYFDQLDVMADGSDLIVSLAMSGDQLVQLVSTVSASGNVTVSL